MFLDCIAINSMLFDSSKGTGQKNRNYSGGIFCAFVLLVFALSVLDLVLLSICMLFFFP